MFPEESLMLLEYHEILRCLAGHARTHAAQERALSLRPLDDPNRLAALRDSVTCARKIFDAMGSPPVHSMEGMENLSQKLRIGEIMSLADLRSVADFLRHCRLLLRFCERAQPIGPLVAGWGLSVDPLDDVREEIERCIRGDAVDDAASGELKSIRQKKEKCSSQIREKLASLLRSHPNWFQESYSSMRGGRHVLPVKREYRAQVKGSALDQSASGATVFVEPDSVTALQREHDLLAIAEENEVLRILATLTAQVAERSRALSANREAMIELDYVFACARLGADMRGATPSPTAKRELELKNARHPLLGPGAVPLTVSLGGVKGLVITGPNTGGKTVALKTVGLLSLMALSGLQVPADGAVVPMFSGVYCDIGDGQSISQNLSTFSSHVKRIVAILSQADGRSLVLLDELGSGTDPQEGMGLAVAVLEELGRRSCLLVATSHYPEIKHFASTAPGFCNARMTFDRATLSPQYRLEMGEAGESCALYIAKRLGLPEKLLTRAWAVAYPGGEAVGMEAESFAEPQASAPLSLSNMAPEEDMPVPDAPKEKKTPAGAQFALGDGVYVTSMSRHGVVCRERNARGEIGVRIQGKNYMINEKRVKPFLSASELYPGEGYDLDIVLNSWDERKAKRDVRKGKPGAVAVIDEGAQE